jgi:hypothetical protein
LVLLQAIDYHSGDSNDISACKLRKSTTKVDFAMPIPSDYKLLRLKNIQCNQKVVHDTLHHKESVLAYLSALFHFLGSPCHRVVKYECQDFGVVLAFHADNLCASIASFTTAFFNDAVSSFKGQYCQSWNKNSMN